MQQCKSEHFNIKDKSYPSLFFKPKIFVFTTILHFSILYCMSQLYTYRSGVCIELIKYFLFRNKMSKRSVNVTETSLQFTDLEKNSEYSAYLTASTRFGDGNIKSDTITFRTSEGGKLIYSVNF